MDKFISLNTFGNLTVNGQKFKFENFDKDKNGVISESEYNEALKTAKLDVVELSQIDVNGNKNISESEFGIWEQKILMQDALNGLTPQISKDFSAKSQYFEKLTEDLKNLVNDYAKTFQGNVSDMANSFIG